MGRALQLKGIQIRRDQFLLGPLTHAFTYGEIHLIRGPNGSGKSSLLKALSGALKPLSGEMIERPKSFATVGLDGFLFETWTVDQNFEFLRCALQSSHSLPTEVQPFKNRRLDHLSTGQRRQVELSCALSLPFEGLFLDEPLNPLDERARSFWARRLCECAKSDQLVLMTTHHPDELGQKIQSELFLPGGSL